MKSSLITVVIPLYNSILSDEEVISLRCITQQLSQHPISLIIPEDIDQQPLLDIVGNCNVIRVSNDWLGTKNGIGGYNTMMLSSEFYQLFANYEYILICQSDVWIFRDELTMWCSKGYDYVGAPFPKRWVYNTPLARLYLNLRRLTNRRILRQDLLDRAYNGGFSLRKVDSFIEACAKYHHEASNFISHQHHQYNEDVFWSLTPTDFKYPSTSEALKFAFDVKPEYCYQLTGGKLPFGCHGWFKTKRRNFWRQIIGWVNLSQANSKLMIPYILATQRAGELGRVLVFEPPRAQ